MTSHEYCYGIDWPNLSSDFYASTPLLSPIVSAEHWFSPSILITLVWDMHHGRLIFGNDCLLISQWDRQLTLEPPGEKHETVT